MSDAQVEAEAQAEAEALSQAGVLVMPSKSAKQARTMRAAAHDPQFAKKVGIPQSVARDFERADSGGSRPKAGQPVKRKGK